jgi:hypothetical protein
LRQRVIAIEMRKDDRVKIISLDNLELGSERSRQVYRAWLALISIVNEDYSLIGKLDQGAVGVAQRVERYRRRHSFWPGNEANRARIRASEIVAM